jgi:uncharacterized protein (TIGR01777 family)
LQRTATVPASAEAVRLWHRRPGAFSRLVPPWERLCAVDRDESRTTCHLGLGPLSFRCVITHQVEAETAAVSRVTDRVEWEGLTGVLGEVASGLLHQRLDRLLRYAQEVRRGDLEAHARFSARPRLHVAVTGASGLLGSMLVPFLTSGGHRVTPLVRRTPRPGEARWNSETGAVEPGNLGGVDAMIHLAGENIGARWTEQRKRRIRESRSRVSRGLAESLSRWSPPAQVLVSASAVGIYGDRGDTVLTETSGIPDPPTDFLVEVAREWEAATEPARARGVRVVSLRFGVILTPAGGALKAMLPPFRLGLGGPLGGGSQWLSWIAPHDAVGAIHHALMTDALQGPVNTTAPNPVTNREFATTLGRVLNRPALLPLPAAAVRLALGEMGEVVLLGGARVLPARLRESGFLFRHPELEGTLRQILGREASGGSSFPG